MKAAILVVDDDPTIRKIVLRILGSQHGPLVEADCGATATIVASNEEHIDLLLSDVVMPDESGPRLAARLRETRKDLRVLFMSGYPRVTLEKHGLRDDDAFVQKPFRAEELRDAVRDALDAPAPGGPLP